MELPIHDQDYFGEVAGSGLKLTEACYVQAHAMGWHKDYHAILNLDIDEELKDTLVKHYVATKLMLSVSELGEAMEGSRKGLPDDKLPHYPMLGVELADCIIRCHELGGILGFDLGMMIAEKLLFNATRPDHQKANREAPGGKSY